MPPRSRRLGAVTDRDGGGSEHYQPSAIEPPDWIDDDARAVWTRVAPVVPPGRLTTATAEAFAHLCVALASYTEAHSLVAAGGGVLIATTGQDLIPNPALQIRDTQGRTAQTWLKVFGLTPDTPTAQPARGGVRRVNLTGQTPASA